MDLDLVVVGGDGVERDIVVSSRPGHRVADLAEALGDHLGVRVAELHVVTGSGSRPFDLAVELQHAGLQRGDVLTVRPRVAADEVWEVAVTGGPDSGHVFPLRGVAELGRGSDVDLQVHDPFVSRRHVRLEADDAGVRVADLGSANGTLVAGRPVPAGQVVGDEPLELGSTLLRIRRRGSSMRPAGSVDAAGNVEVARRESSPSSGVVEGATLTTVAGVPLEELLGDEARRQRARWPDLPTLATSARQRDELLWSRTTWPGELRVRVGWGAGQAGVAPIRGGVASGDRPGGVAAVPAVPLVVDLAAGTTQLRGDPAALHGVARNVLLQVAALVPPTEPPSAATGDPTGLQVTILVSTDHAPEWAWVRWLPQARADRVAEPRVAGVHVGAGEAVGVVRDLTRSPVPTRHLVVLDAALAGAEDHLAALAAAGVRVVAVGPLPGPAATTVDVDPDDGSVEVAASAGTVVGAGADGTRPDEAAVIARHLAPLVLPGSGADATEDRPALAAIVPAADPDGVAATWAAARARRIPIGVTDAGAATISLDQPVLVSGDVEATREVVASVIAGVATTVGPDRLALAVEAGLLPARCKDVADFPHVVALLDAADLAEDLDRELGRRAAWLAGVGATSWAQLRGDGADVPAPLVVVTRAASLSGAMAEVGPRLAEDGPLLGIHVVVVAEAGHEPPSLVADGVRLDVGPDGRATLHDGGTRLEVRLADARPTRADDDTALRVTELVDGRATGASYTTLQRIPDPVDPVAALVAVCREAARTTGRPRATWCPSPPAGQDLRVRRTFVFTDIVGSTALVEVIGDTAWADLVGWHDRTLREAFADHEGEEVDHAGDGFLVAFVDPASAVACASDIQRRLERHRTEAGFAPRVRIGGAVAEVVRTEGYKGHGLHVAARVGSLADGDQVIFSADTIESIQPRPRTVASRVVEVKGATEPIEVLEVDWR